METPGLTTFTAREFEVLKLIMEGKTNKEIAAILNIKEQTTKNYVRIIYDKMQVSRRVEVILEAIKLGMIKIPRDTSRVGQTASHDSHKVENRVQFSDPLPPQFL